MNLDFSLIDANIGRAKEGIRVLEDICRFGLRRESFFSELKIIRHNMDQVAEHFGPAHLLMGRKEPEIGKGEVVSEEYHRQSVWSLVRANCQRVAESLRVLEEFAKVYNKDLSYSLENYRYKIYELELKILIQTPQFWLNKYFEEGVVYPLTESVEEALWLIDQGAKILQLRDKESSRIDVYKKTKYLCEYISKIEIKNKNRKILLILNDDVEIAGSLPVAGVHLGQKDGTIRQARHWLGSLKIIGRSNHSVEQIKKSMNEGWDYLSIGPVYSTPTKEGRPAVGLEIVKETAKLVQQPWLAIGGIDKNNLQEVYNAGAKNVAVVRSAREFFEH